MSDTTVLPQQGTTPPTPSGLRPPVAPPEPPKAPASSFPQAPLRPAPVAPPSTMPASPMGRSMPVIPNTPVRPTPVPPPVMPMSTSPMIPVQQTPPASSAFTSTPKPSTQPTPLTPPPAPFKVIPQAPVKPIAPPYAQPNNTAVNPPAGPASAKPLAQNTTPKPFSMKPDISEKPGAVLARPNDVQKSPFRFLPFILGVLVILALGWFAFTKFFGGASKPAPTPAPNANTVSGTPTPAKTTLTWWGLWEPSPVLDETLRAFEAQNPGVKVNYVQESPTDYRERLQDALKKGEGPDVFRFHNSWVPMLRSSMAIMPPTVYSQESFTSTFYPVAAKDLRTSEGIVGVPLMYDSIALYYNKAIFTTAGKTVPTTWNDLDALATSLTVRDTTGKIQRAGIALGTTSNVDHYPEILTLLLLQNGADPSNLSTPLASQAFKYYTDFSKVKKVWDSTLPNSTYAFATEKSAMMLAPSWRAFDVKSINPNLDFGIAQAPQLPGTNVTVATYWAEGVSKTSKNQAAAWKLLQYMSSKEVLQKLHSAAAQKTPRLFGEIYPRVDMAADLASDPYAGPFVADAPKATSWYMNSRTFDNGINDKIIKYVEDAINAINVNGTSPTDALTTADLGIKQVLQQYGIPVSSTTP